MYLELIAVIVAETIIIAIILSKFTTGERYGF